MLGSCVKKCLQKCDEIGANTIAFPSIGTGNLGYPSDVIAKTMIKEVFDYLSCNKKSKLAIVYLMIFEKDTLLSFQKEMAQYTGNTWEEQPSIDGMATKKGKGAASKKDNVRKSVHSQARQDSFDLLKSAFTINNVLVNISCGDITDSNCDVIVNPTNPTITLTGGGVAGAILSKGGPELQQLCNELTSNGKTLDGTTLVLETKATGKLKSKFLFHML